MERPPTLPLISLPEAPRYGKIGDAVILNGAGLGWVGWDEVEWGRGVLTLAGPRRAPRADAVREAGRPCP